MTTRRLHPVPAAIIAAIGLLGLAGRGASPAPAATGDPAPAVTGSPEAGEPASVAPSPGSAAEAAREDFLYGTFRRGAVPIPPDVLADAERACRAKPVPANAEEIGSRRVVVSDLRGQGIVLLVFADARGATGCRIAIDPAGGIRASHFAIATDDDGPLEDGALTLGALLYPAIGADQMVISVGRVGEGAVKVRAGFDDDTYVTSTMANGWYAMWWPGATRPAIIVAADNRNLAMGKLTPP